MIERAAVIIAIPSMLLVSLVSMWLERTAVRLTGMQIIPNFRFAMWGLDDGRWFLLVKLPSLDWRQDIRRFDHWCWHQRVLSWRQGNTEWDGWHVWYWPVSEKGA